MVDHDRPAQTTTTTTTTAIIARAGDCSARESDRMRAEREEIEGESIAK
jgi:hypothetical protein